MFHIVFHFFSVKHIIISTSKILFDAFFPFYFAVNDYM